MPLPANLATGRLEVPAENLSKAVEVVLEKTGILSARDRVQRALDSQGMDIESLANHLCNLIHSSKDATKLKAILNAFEMQGVATRLDQTSPSSPTVNFVVHSDNGTVNLQNLFSPQREI